jgi:hypothetical protein
MRAGANEIPLLLGFGVASGAATWALAQTTATNNQIKVAVTRQMLFAGDIDLETFQQGTFGPGEIVKIRVAEETPAAKN